MAKKLGPIVALVFAGTVLLVLMFPEHPASNLLIFLQFAFLILLGIRWLFIKGLSNLYWPEATDMQKKPIYGPGYKAKNERKFGEAIAYFITLTKEFPNQAESYIALMDIYASEYQDEAQLDIIYKWGREKIQDKTEMSLLEDNYAMYKKILKENDGTEHPQLEDEGPERLSPP